MSAAFYIVVDSPDPGFDTFVNGTALSRADAAVEVASPKAGVTLLREFFSASPDDIAALAEDFGEEMEAAGPPPEEQWFAAGDGLRTIKALLALLESDPLALGEGVREELLEFEAVLQQAEDRELRWHLAVDY
jgi:hypothetical protein